jgi:hypothetical protein
VACSYTMKDRGRTFCVHRRTSVAYYTDPRIDIFIDKVQGGRGESQHTQTHSNRIQFQILAMGAHIVHALHGSARCVGLLVNRSAV